MGVRLQHVAFGARESGRAPAERHIDSRTEPMARSVASRLRSINADKAEKRRGVPMGTTSPSVTGVGGSGQSTA